MVEDLAVAFAAVTQGSSEPPALIVLRYEPPTDSKTPPSPNAPLLGLVGKGITFDTGDISIKPASDMDKMKYDMAGAASMIASMRAIAQLKPAVRVLCVVCSCENMPDGRAFKPGDVVTAMSGKTIEIINTDAEGPRPPPSHSGPTARHIPAWGTASGSPQSWT